jgi:hypothetical protein
MVQQLAAQMLWSYNVRIHQIEAELARSPEPPHAPKKKPIGFKTD